MEEFKASIMKNGKVIDVNIKIVFYYLSYPICSVSIDEGLKKQVQ